jgi:hypothetical protein
LAAKQLRQIPQDTDPGVASWIVNGTSAKPDPGYYDYWAKLGLIDRVYDAKDLPMPALVKGNNILETVYLYSTNNPPPS